MADVATKTLEAKASQRDGAKRATLDALKGKKRSERELQVVLNEGDEPLTFLFRALGVVEYDRLMTANPPGKEQLVNGAGFNVNTFGPQLLSKVCADPLLSPAEWTEVWTSPEWSGGEIGVLFNAAMELCNKALDLTPIAAG